ncbi:MAG: DUF1573 domain-containing protein [Sphingobacteriales bacterium]|nr:MAG: DUF1573 domain-containing protein [Sphingobacteriales bacterium]
MKKIVTLLVLLVAGTAVWAQVAPATPNAALLILKETSFDFGSIQQGRPVTHEFLIANNSADTLKIEDVRASCGCTTPVWTREPLNPNGNSKITVGYNAYSEGPFEKTVTIIYNGGQTKILTIKGAVYKAPAASAPENKSIALIKNGQ